MTIWTVLRNYKLIWGLVLSMKALIAHFKISDGKPDGALIVGVLDALEELLDNKVIDIPGVDESNISDILKHFEKQIKGV